MKLMEIGRTAVTVAGDGGGSGGSGGGVGGGGLGWRRRGRSRWSRAGRVPEAEPSLDSLACHLHPKVRGPCCTL